MSHFSKVATQFRNREILTQCLEGMGYTIRTDGQTAGNLHLTLYVAQTVHYDATTRPNKQRKAERYRNPDY